MISNQATEVLIEPVLTLIVYKNKFNEVNDKKHLLAI